jgi:hypothetical protein
MEQDMNVRKARALGFRHGWNSYKDGGFVLPPEIRAGSKNVFRAYLNAANCGSHERRLLEVTGMTGPERRDLVRQMAVDYVAEVGPDYATSHPEDKMPLKISKSAKAAYLKTLQNTVKLHQELMPKLAAQARDLALLLGIDGALQRLPDTAFHKGYLNQYMIEQINAFVPPAPVEQQPA